MYQRRYHEGNYWCLYDGYWWMTGNLDFDVAKHELRFSNWQSLPWKAILK